MLPDHFQHPVRESALIPCLDRSWAIFPPDLDVTEHFAVCLNIFLAHAGYLLRFDVKVLAEGRIFNLSMVDSPQLLHFRSWLACHFLRPRSICFFLLFFLLFIVILGIAPEHVLIRKSSATLGHICGFSFILLSCRYFAQALHLGIYHRVHERIERINIIILRFSLNPLVVFSILRLHGNSLSLALHIILLANRLRGLSFNLQLDFFLSLGGCGFICILI
mmetsp:Transcript_7978/g.29508  ORF Transcript_7978/g.29508 Transcript_7978/m.29508 type:complete len:220 (-) Transcript_7978:537-1196(-)